MNKFFDYTDELEFSSNFSPEESVQKLNSIVKKRNRLSYEDALFGENLLFGKVGLEKVMLYNARPFIRNDLKPVFYGKFVKENNRTILRGKFKVYNTTKYVIIILGIVYFVFLGNIALQLVKGVAIDVFALFWVIFFTLFFLFGRNMSRDDVNGVSEKIRKALH